MILIIEILFLIVLVIAIVISVKLDNYSSSYSVISLAMMIILWVINAYCVSTIVNQPIAIDVYKR